MAPLPKMTKSVCLIENGKDNELGINKDAQTILAKISQPLIVVSIVGPYRSGKSYLINKLSGQRDGVFSVDPTIQANTKGIWMWCMQHPIKYDHTLVLLDTEGLGDPDKGDNHNDSMILSLALLMSSAVIYNSVGVINQDTLEKLNSTLNVHSEILQKVKAQTQEDTKKMAPLFVWLIRDFTLKSELHGRSLTSDEYLEDCLKNVPAKTINGRKKNDMRDNIRNHFPKRKCFYFGFPSGDKEVIGSMSHVSEAKLAPEFVRQTKDFCQFILQEASTKKMAEDRVMTGSAFAQLLKSYINVVTKCDISHLERSVLNITLKENQRSIQRCTISYENKMKSQQFCTEEEFQKLHERSLGEALCEFKKSYVKHEKSRDEYLHQLEKELLEKRRELWKMCEDSSLKTCEEVYKQLMGDVNQAIGENKYHGPGGYEAFVKDKDNLIQIYNEKCDKSIKAQEVLKKLSDSLEEIGKTIPKAVQATSAKKCRQLRKGDSEDFLLLTQYIRDYQLPSKHFDGLLIQLFGYAGHGKSSFVNSSSFVLLDKVIFQDWAGEGACHGGKTMERKQYKLTDTITIVDNRGFATLDGPEAWEIYAQLGNFAPFNEKVEWKKSFQARKDLLIRKIKENAKPELIVPVFVCSSEHKLNDGEFSDIKEFLGKAHELTGIQPFVVLTKKGSDSELRTRFEWMGIENICSIENYIVLDHMPLLPKHLTLLNFFKDVLQSVDFHLQESDNFQNGQYEWMSFLMEMATNIQHDLF